MNRKNLTAAVLAGLAGVAGIVGSAQAVNVNPDGLGEVLLYPYYTTNGNNLTVLSVVNTTGKAKAVKVRFLEGENSREVLDFNLYMSAYDVWTAALGVKDDGTTFLATADTSCTVPYFYGDQDGMQDFLPWALDDKNPKEFDDITRAAEGHFNLIEMGTIVDELTEIKDASGNLTGKFKPTYGSALAATHDDDGVPEDCDQLVDAWTYGATASKNGYWLKDNFNDMQAPSGGLFGGAAIVNVEDGTMYSYDAKAINGFAAGVTGDDDMHQEPGTILPSLDSGGIYDAAVFGSDGNVINSQGLTRGVDAVSFVFMHDQVMNEYSTERGIDGGTEWVMTFPTKQFYVHQSFLDDNADYRDNGMLDGSDDSDLTAPVVPFTTVWEWVPATKTKDAYLIEPCEVVRLDTIWDREEQEPTPPPGVGRPPIVSPAPPPVDPDAVPFFSLCHETSVIRFGGADAGTDDDNSGPSEILGSANFINIDNDELGYEFGWARLDLVDASSDDDEDGDIDSLYRKPLGGLYGLPVTGFAVQRFGNYTLGSGGDVIANYGGIFQHKGTRSAMSGL